MNPFVQELAELLNLSVPDNVEDEEMYLQIAIKDTLLQKKSFVKELASLLRIKAPEDTRNEELFLKHKITQEVSHIFLNQRSLKRKIDEIDRKTLLHRI